MRCYSRMTLTFNHQIEMDTVNVRVIVEWEYLEDNEMNNDDEAISDLS